jgi:hypothetical protein
MADIDKLSTYAKEVSGGGLQAMGELSYTPQQVAEACWAIAEAMLAEETKRLEAEPPPVIPSRSKSA